MELREMLELAALAAGLRYIDYSHCDYDGALGIGQQVEVPNELN